MFFTAVHMACEAPLSQGFAANRAGPTPPIDFRPVVKHKILWSGQIFHLPAPAIYDILTKLLDGPPPIVVHGVKPPQVPAPIMARSHADQDAAGR